MESVIALGLVVVAMGAMALLHSSDKRNAEQVIAQLQMVKSGVLKYNINDPKSTNKLSDLVRPNLENQDSWNGPYIDSATLLTSDGQVDISKIFPDSHLELVIENINGINYQAVMLKGLAESSLKNSILAKCGDDCKPLPERDDIGLLIQQVGVVAKNGTGFGTDTVSAVGLPPAIPPTPWTGPSTNVGPTITTTPQTPAVPTPPITPPPTPSTPVPTPLVPTVNPNPPTTSEPLPFAVQTSITTTETQTLACPDGYLGTRVQSRTKTYTHGTGLTVYSAWADYINTCTPPPPPPPPPVDSGGGGGGGGCIVLPSPSDYYKCNEGMTQCCFVKAGTCFAWPPSC